MPRWFLSYHSPDQSLAERIIAGIKRKDPALGIFFAPTNLRAGGAWTDQLAEQLAVADAFILLIGEAGVGKWQVPEYDEALDRWVKSSRTFPLIVVLLEGHTAPGLPFLRQLHWIVAPDPGSEKDVARIFDAASGGGARPSELWRYASPYRGLEAMEEKDSDYFFGRTRETIETLDALQAPGRLPVLIGNSGVGKSSIAQAGVLAALKRQGWPNKARPAEAWPAVFKNSRQWCYLSLKPGAEPLKALVDGFLDAWQFEATDPKRVERQRGWIEALQGTAKLADLIEATERRRLELDQQKPPAFFLYVDQGEELYARADERERRRFSELLSEALPDPRLHMMMSLRSDFLGSLQSDKPLFRARLQIDVPPLAEEELRGVVSRPAELLGARFKRDQLIDIIAQRTAEDSVKDVGALPLLSYTLDDMWREMQQAGDGVLRLPAQSFELGGVLVDRANKFLAERPGTADALKRVLTLKLATVREDGEPTRRRAQHAEFSGEEWRLVSELSGYPNRLLVTATTEGGEAYAEVAHETIFRRWDKLKEWIAAEREFLAWRNGLEAARRSWEKTPDKDKNDALLMGFALTQADSWLAKRSGDISDFDRRFIVESRKAAKRRQRWVQALVAVLVATVGAGTAAWWNHDLLKERIYTLVFARALSSVQESALKVRDDFKECHDCPEMIVVPAGQFKMGNQNVTIARPFAVAKFALAFDEWDACAAHGDCSARISDEGWGRGRRPVINATWDEAQTYVSWLSRITGKPYRLLSEAEYEYAARAGSQTKYPWGDDIELNGEAMANCQSCGSEWNGEETAPVGSFPANGFGLYDMVGNVWSWTEDCWHGNHEGGPYDGSAWVSGDCGLRVQRGGGFQLDGDSLSSALRYGLNTFYREKDLGFRVARTLYNGADVGTGSKLEQQKSKDTLALGERRSEATRILEIIKIGNPSVNLQSLLDAGLLRKDTAVRIAAYLSTRQPGLGDPDRAVVNLQSLVDADLLTKGTADRIAAYLSARKTPQAAPSLRPSELQVPSDFVDPTKVHQFWLCEALPINLGLKTIRDNLVSDLKMQYPDLTVEIEDKEDSQPAIYTINSSGGGLNAPHILDILVAPSLGRVEVNMDWRTTNWGLDKDFTITIDKSLRTIMPSCELGYG